MLNKKHTIVVIVVLGVVITGGIGLFLLRKPQFTAQNQPGTATLSLLVLENNRPGLGRLYISLGCAEQPLASQDGTFTCHLSPSPTFNMDTQTNYEDKGVTPVFIAVPGLTYQPASSSQLLSLPIAGGGDVDQDLTIAPGTRLTLQAVITFPQSNDVSPPIAVTDDQTIVDKATVTIVLRQWINGNWVDITATGIRPVNNRLSPPNNTQAVTAE